MKNLLLALSLLIGTGIFAQNWKDLGTWGEFGNSQEMQIAILDNGTPIVSLINSGGAIEFHIWQFSSWQMLPTPFAGIATNLQMINHGDTIYIGFSTLTSNYEVYNWSGGVFTQMGNLSALNITITPNAAQLTVNQTTSAPMLSLWRPDCCGGVANSDVYLWSGAAWTQHGPSGFIDNGMPEIYNMRAASSGDFSFYAAYQFDGGGASIDPNDDNLGISSSNNSRSFGFPDLRLYRIDESAPSSWTVDGGTWVYDDVPEFDLECIANKEPVGAFVAGDDNTQLKMFRGNGGSAVLMEPFFNTPSAITDIDLQVLNTDSALVLYTNSPILTYNTHLMMEDAGTFVEIGAPGVTVVDLSRTQLDISKYTNKPYVMYWDGLVTGVRVFNTAPVFNSSTPANSVCQDAVNFVALDEVVFDDMDYDSCKVWVISQSPALVQSANITVAPTQAWSPSDQANKFSIAVTTEAGMNGTANIDIYCTDGIDTIFTSTTFVINALPTAAISLPTNNICENEGAQVLTNSGTPAGGIFEGTAVYNNVLYPSQTGVGAFNLSYIYQDANGCKDTATQIINVLDIPITTLAITNADCGQTNGAVDATITGGTAPYTVYWSNGSSTEDILNVGANMYYMNVTDANGCYTMNAATVSSNGLSVSGVTQDVLCNGDATGAINLTVSGAGPFMYQWSNGASTEDITGLVAGQYEVFVTDGSGCTAMESVTIVEPAAINANFALLNASCGGNDGAITLNVAGGNSPYTFQWFDGVGSPFGPNANLVSGISGGDYSVSVADANGCAQSFNGVLPENGGPTVIPLNVMDAGCTDDGAIDIGINSTNGIQTILWSNGASTEDISGLTTGYYSVTVTDNLGCIGMVGISVNPAVPSVTDICVVTVDTSTNTNLIVWEKIVSTEISHWNVYRESSVAGVFQFVDSVLYTEDSQYNDTIAYPHLRSWRYVLTTVNNCGIESYDSPEHKTIHLTINAGLPGDYNLNWDAYEGFTYPTYFIYRYTNQSGWVEIQQLAFGQGSLTDTPPSMVGLDYIISVDPPATCTSSKATTDYNSSRSNSTSATANNPADDSGLGENAFGLQIFPNPSTDIFKLMFDNYENYDLQVYDLSGKLIISTSISAQTYVLDLSGFARGSYTVMIQNDEAVVVEKLILR
jgi:Secretion system C-terminal sorting domain/SprB repeat